MSFILLEEQATPSTPPADKVKIYPKAGGGLWILNDLGVESQVTAGSGDMLKATYDPDDNGVVNSAESVDGGTW